MKRKLAEIQSEVTGFYKSKGPNIEVRFPDIKPGKPTDDLQIRVVLTKGEETGSLRIQNKFSRQDGPWDELLEKLEDFWNDDFPNDKPKQIVPCP